MSFIKKNKNSFIKILKNFSFEKEILNTCKLFKKCSLSKNKVIFLGNGGSASIASHVSVDLTKNAKIRSVNFNETDLITCFANDFGHENAMAWLVESNSAKDDLLIAISSSGESVNILNAVKKAKNLGIKVIGLSGFYANSLASLADYSICIESRNYGVIEDTHSMIMHSLAQSVHEKLYP